MRNGKSNPLILNKLKEVCRCHFDGLNSSKRREKLSYEEPTIRKRINFCFFCVFHQVIRIEVSGYSSRGYSCNHDTLPIVEVKLGVEVAKLLHCVVVSSEVELLIFVGYWLSPASCVLWPVTVNYVYFGPIVENGVVLGEGWKQSFSIKTTSRSCLFGGSKTSICSSIAGL